jgi:hypothetical protein
MPAKKINVCKAKVWGERSTMEIEGPTADVALNVFGMIPSAEARKAALEKMQERHQVLIDLEAART